MGVPKFFRYISERYPCLSEIVKEYQIPDFDNLYLDMNGIIHTCSHPDDGDAHFRITEEKIFEDIFHYIEVLFRMIRPQKLFFMAVDGVAPRAKMNQQRGRRFNSAKDAQKLEQIAKKRGEVLPQEARFDSNCITPGTPFMVRLQEQLKYFIVNKVSTDNLWSKCTIILSGHETPGEGEHKIMDYIRYLRSQPDYDPNTRHCLYGLDADLIMLGLCTHESHFSLLREEVKFGKKSTKRKNVPEEITFYLLHLSLMREYLELEFQALKDCLSFEFNLENIIDDWVLMGFLVGNDFIPNLPNLHIANGALPILYSTYIKVMPSLGGYINEAGTLNLSRFEKFMEALSEIDMEHFAEQYADLKYFEGKTGRKLNERERTSYKSNAIDEVDNIQNSKEAEVLEPSIENLRNLALEPDPFEICGEADEFFEPEDAESDISSSSDDEFLNEEFRLHKRDYYMNKLEYEQVTPEILRDQAEGYVKAIQWNLNYYYNGCCSWSWYYPHHYAPYISDIKGFTNLKIEFELGEPFKPFEQLLAVLPAASKDLLPQCYQELMTSEHSPLKKYYPEEFAKDLNGKKQDWEAVVLIPFIDQKLLLEMMEPLNEKLTAEEKKRNSHGPMLVYNHTTENLGCYSAPSYFPSVKENHAKCVALSINDIKVPIDKLVKGAHPRRATDIYYPGFPTLKHLQFTASLEKAKVRVFEQPSRNESMMITLQPCEYEENFIKNMIGRVVYVGWPHLIEALVVAVSTPKDRYVSLNNPGEYQMVANEGGNKNQSVFQTELGGIVEYYKSRLGVNVGETNVLVHVQIMTGRKYVFTTHGRATLEKQFAFVQSHYPLQTVVRDLIVYDENHSSLQDIATIFPAGASCFMLSHPHYGAMGEILEDQECLQKGRVKINLISVDEPNLAEIKQLEMDAEFKYMPLFVACSKLSISRYVFSRITGTVFVVSRNNISDSNSNKKINIGLNLKFNIRNQETPGYTKKSNNNWLYSEKTVNLIKEYMEFCPTVFECLNYNQKADTLILENIFPENSEEKINELRAWLKSKPHYNAERQTSGNLIMDPEIVKKLEETVDCYQNKDIQMKRVIMRVKPQLLFRPSFQVGRIPPDPQATYEICDRVVNVREGYSVPLGSKGTIIGIRNVDENEQMYDVVFDNPFAGGFALNCSNNRGYRVPPTALINISYGNRVYQEKTGVPGKLWQAVQRTKQNYIKPTLNKYNSKCKTSDISAFAPVHDLLPIYYDRRKIIPPISMPYNQLYTGQPLLKTVILKHDAANYQTNLNTNIDSESSNLNGPMSSHTVQGGDIGVKISILKRNTEVNKKIEQQNEANNEQIVSHELKPIRKVAPATDILKKMLKINEAFNQKIPMEAQRNRGGTNQEQSDCVKLVSYYQLHNLGCPQYQYFKNGNTITAQVALPGDKVFIGKPCRTKEDASESAARAALQHLAKRTRTYLSPNKCGIKPKSPKSFPTPPQQWRNKRMANEFFDFSLKESAQRDVKAFVPLQAVRGASQTARSPTKKNVSISNSNKNTQAASLPKEKQISKLDTPPTQIKRRERKSRIVANFSKANVQVES